jgi:hypothetical protein
VAVADHGLAEVAALAVIDLLSLANHQVVVELLSLRY